MHQQYIERVVDLTEPEANRIYDLPVEEARKTMLHGSAEAVAGITGSFALIAREGKTVKMARSLDRPLRYFLAKRQEGPVLIVAARIDAIYHWLKAEGLEAQFHPSYTRMVPAHHVVTLQLVGCPDPDPVYTRFFTPSQGGMSTRPRSDRRSIYWRTRRRAGAVAAQRACTGANRCLFFRRH